MNIRNYVYDGAMAAPQLSFKRLEVFCLVVETGSVTRAAEHMLVAQPAVSAQIKALEEWFGARLFVRNAGRLRTTEAGDRAYSWAKQALARSVSIRRDVQELAIGGAGRLVVVASLGIGTYVVPGILARLRAERPAVDIVLHTGQPEQALRSVENGEADFAIVTWYNQAMPTTLHVERLKDEPIYLYASTEGPPTGDRVTLAKLKSLSFVGVPSNVALDHVIAAQLREVGVENLDVVIRLGHAESMKAAVREHHWVTLLPAYVLNDETPARLRTLRIEGVQLYEPLVLVRRRDHILSPFQSIAYDALVGSLGPVRDADASL